MAGMYPENEDITIFGEKVQWPGVDKNGKFTNGSFSDPHEKPSFIPAGTINLILDNLSALITKLGGKPDNSSVEQLAGIFTSEVKANTGIVRDAAGCAKVAAPAAADDIARKAEVDAEAQARAQGDKSIVDYGDSSGNRKIQVGYAGPSLQAGELLHLAGYTQAGSKLKDATEDAVRKLLGLDAVDNTADKDKSVKYAASARHSDTSNLLQAYTTDDYAGGNRFIKAIRESGWNMRLYGCYFNGAKQSDCVKVNYANSAGKAATADSAKNADTVGGYRAGNGVNMLVPVVAFNVGENAGYIKLGNGLIVQWGHVVGDEVDVTLPLAYSHYYSISLSTKCHSSSEDWSRTATYERKNLKSFHVSVCTTARIESDWLTIGF